MLNLVYKTVDMKLNKLLIVLLGVIILVACSEEDPAPTNVEVEDFETTIDENPLQDQLLGTIVVTNSTGTLSFTLGNELPDGAMNISSSGELTVANPDLFDFDTNPIITATVTVTDDNSSGTGNITITLNEVSDPTQFTIWDGADITFTKADGADPTLAENQDRITDNVWITRGNDGGQIYNAVSESAANKVTSPAGTKWSEGTIAQISSLEFKQFREAVGSPKNVVGKNLIVYLEADDVYIPVKFNEWSERRGGGFSYTRGTEPN